MPPRNQIDAAWLGNYRKLVEYKKQHGNCNVPSRDPALGGWVRGQRKLNNKNNLRSDRKRKLDAIGFDWAPSGSATRSEAAWSVMYQKLVDYHAENGHCNLPSMKALQKQEDTDTNKEMKKLVTWTYTQRGRRKITNEDTSPPHKDNKGTGTGRRRAYSALSQNQIELLDKLGFEWNPQDFDRVWDKKFSQLEEFKAQNGDCLVPQSHPELGTWVNCQRRRYQQEKLEQDRIQKLESIGFVWFVAKEDRKCQKYDDSWDKHYQFLLQYKQEHGDLFVPHETTCGEDGSIKLGHWVSDQRIRRDLLPERRRKALDEIGFVWNTIKEIWWKNFELLKEFHKEHGHCHIPRATATNKSLNEWTQAQRDRRKGRVVAKTGKLKYSPLTEEQIQALDSLEFPWSGDCYDDHLWKEGFKKLQRFKEMHGHCLATQLSDATGVASWIKTQRKLFKEGNLSQERIDRLESIGFNDWNAKQLKRAKAKEAWSLRFEELKEFHSVHGHCRVPGPAERNPEDEERLSSLYSWVVGQRDRRSNPDGGRGQRPLTKDEIDQLDSIDFVWDTSIELDARWEERLRRLRQYKEENGHCLVPTTYENDQDLANWVTNQRTEYRNGNVTNERIEKLEEVGFEWRVARVKREGFSQKHENKWELKYEKLKIFKEEFGHCLVPGDYREDKSLGRWVAKQRKMLREKRMPVRRKALLDGMGFVWEVDFFQSDKSTHQKLWDQTYIRLRRYKEEFGHLNVRHDHETSDGIKLGQWVTLQRSAYRDGTIDSHRKALLEEVGFLWKAPSTVVATSNSGASRPDAGESDSSDDESVVGNRRPRKRLRLRVAEIDDM